MPIRGLVHHVFTRCTCVLPRRDMLFAGSTTRTRTVTWSRRRWNSCCRNRCIIVAGRITTTCKQTNKTKTTTSYVHRSSESPWRFQTKKLFGDFDQVNFLRKTIRNQPARSLESRSDSEEEGFRNPDENPKGSVGAMTNPDLEVWVALNPARGVLQSWGTWVGFPANHNYFDHYLC